MKNKKIIRKFTVLLAALVIMCGFSVTAYAGGGDESDDTPTPVTEETPAPETEPEETTGGYEPQPLTPDGNMSLVDDITGEASGDKQFITVVTKSGNYFYIIIDRAEDGENTVHFLNQVDEADLTALMEDGQTEAPVCSCTDKCVAGSVNTVTVSEGRLIGTSTDGYGLETALRENFRRPLEGACCCFIGCGGAAHATAFHLAGCGVRAIRIANRTLEKADELAGRLHSIHPELIVETARPDDADRLRTWFADTDFLIQATSLGLRDDDPAPFDLNLLEKNARLRIFDTIYRSTPLLRRAAELEIPAADGAAMLIYQGAKSFEIWTGLPAPIDAMRRGFLEDPEVPAC